MIGLLQRVTQASVVVDGETVAAIEHGLLVLIGVVASDTAADATRLATRIVGYRVFPDAKGRMNCSLRDVGGALLLVPQFTLVADTRKGLRPSFSTAAAPTQAQPLFEALVAATRAQGLAVQSGRFGAEMQVSLTNDGPVTFWLQS